MTNRIRPFQFPKRTTLSPPTAINVTHFITHHVTKFIPTTRFANSIRNPTRGTFLTAKVVSFLPASDTHEYRRGKTCAACRQTGYRGRLAICELLIVQDAIRKRIQERASAAEIQETAVKLGMQLLREDGLAKILAGMTTPEEVVRVTVRSDF